jgi:hypothetical protein
MWKNGRISSASERTVVGLKSDGTIVFTDFYGQEDRYDVPPWRDIIAVTSNGFCIVGLKADGTVVVAGDTYFGEDKTQDWKDIIAISAGVEHIVGLKADGTLAATGINDYGECEVEDWTGLVTGSLK